MTMAGSTFPDRPDGSAPTPRCAPPPDRNLVLARSWIASVVWTAATAGVVIGLFGWLGRVSVAPSVMGDNAYIFLAADRMYGGSGATCTPPQAPFQPWTWRADWAFLTQWPVGYPLLICAMRMLVQATTVKAAAALSVVCCGVGLVAWFAWMVRCLGRNVTAMTVALAACLGVFQVSELVNPASDTVLLAAVPLVLILAVRWLESNHATSATRPPSLRGAACLGLLAGGLFWIRYAAIFVPVGIGAYLLVASILSRRVGPGHVFLFGVGCMVPIAGLIAINHILGLPSTVSEQLNLGHTARWTIDPRIPVHLWRNFTTRTPYAHRPEAFWFFAAVLPIGGLVLPLLTRRARRSAGRFWRQPAVQLSAVMVAALWAMLAAATVLFRDKFNYAQLDRYYLAVRPLYWVLFVGPLAVLPRAWFRAGIIAMMVLFGAWFVRQDHIRAFRRITARQQARTPSGRWAMHFEPGSSTLYAWLKAQRADHLVVFSNFHDEIALETGIPACPLPETPSRLDGWLAKIREARHVPSLRVLFVLEPDDTNRDYFQPSVTATIEALGLAPVTGAPTAVQPYVFQIEPPLHT